MRYIDTQSYPMEIGPIVESTLGNILKESYSKSKKLILVDENTHEHCLYYLIDSFEALKDAEIVQLPSGEENKQLDIAQSVWEAFTDYRVTRQDILINLGGGLITDMGGFIASCYKRGIDFINIPTSLVGMVDASIGGKTGVNLDIYKNQIGLFSNPVALFIDPVFLETLPEEELLSGMAEMLKHGAISDQGLFRKVVEVLTGNEVLDDELLEQVIAVKNDIVKQDPKEVNIRKKLNFGHTLGHVIEGHLMNKVKISHGHCVAIGMVMEAFISLRKGLLHEEHYNEFSSVILKHYELPKFTDEDINVMIAMLSNDKKNREGHILCCLLKRIGDCVIDVEVSEEEALESFFHFRNLNLSLN